MNRACRIAQQSSPFQQSHCASMRQGIGACVKGGQSEGVSTRSVDTELRLNEGNTILCLLLTQCIDPVILNKHLSNTTILSYFISYLSIV